MRKVVGDIEADGLYDDVTQIWCAVFKDVRENTLHTFTPANIRELPSFLDSVGALIMHNGARYDLPVIEKILGYRFEGCLLDTLAISRMERSKRFAHSLDSWGITLDFPKQEYSDWSQYSSRMLEYCKNDVELTHRVAKHLGCIREDIPVRHRVISSLFKNLFHQEENGWRVDVRHLDWSIAWLSRWMDRIGRVTEPQLPRIVEVGTELSSPFKRDGNPSKLTEKYCAQAEIATDWIGGPFHRVSFRTVSLDRPSEVKQLLLELGWIPEEWNYDKTGKRTSPKLSVTDSFEGVESRLGKVAAKYTQCKQRRAILLGWQKALRADGRLPSKVSGLAVTSRARHSVIANIPRNTSFFGRQMRRVFVAREGWVLVGADAESCQLRMLAARMGDEEYIRRVCTEDVHSVNQSIAEIDDRTDAKILIYALIFGASNARLTRMLGKEGAPIRAALMNNLPALKQLIREVETLWKATAKTRLNKWGRIEYYDGHVEGLDGRIIPVNSAHKILMGLLQSDEAILMQYAYNLYWNKLLRAGFVSGVDFGVCCWYHDEIQSEARPEIAKEVGRMKCDSIVQAGQYLGIACPMAGSYKIGDNWSETH